MTTHAEDPPTPLPEEARSIELSAAGPTPPPTAFEQPDGSRRRRAAFAVVAVAATAGLAGGVVGNRIQSPADRAASRAGPVPSLITVPVERRALSSELVLSGSVDYQEPTIVQLAGGVGTDPDEAAVVTDIRQVGDDLQEGDVLLEVTGRPVFVLQGALPMYRRLVAGSEGPDVRQLEEALVRLGYEPGTVDSVFDADTAAAVSELYTDAGYVAEGPSVAEREALTGAQEAVRQAEEQLRSAEQAVADAERPMAESERLQLEHSLQSARDGVPAARAAAEETRRAGDQQVAAAQATRDTAAVTRDAAVTLRDRAQSGAIDPDTGVPFTPERIADLQVAAAQAQEAFVAADAALATAQSQRDQANAAAAQAIADAEFNLTLAELQYREATAAPDTSELEQLVVAATTAVDAARVNLTALQAETGLRISPGEVVFVPVMPSALTEAWVGLGAPVTGPIGTLATSSTLVSARVSRVDASLVTVDAPVTIDIRGSGVTTGGTVRSVGEPPTEPGQDGGTGIPVDGGGGGSGRLVVTITPDDPDLMSQYVFWDARIVVSVAATDGEVLVVPVAAITVGPDEVSQVEVETAPATDDEAAVTEIVEVEVGLTAGGLAEVRPIEDGSLVEGDRVVVGVETNERLNEDDVDGPEVPGGDDDGGDGDGGGSGADDDGSGGEGSDDDVVTSPLAALLGYDVNPVEDRRLQLAVEESVADCMRDEGFEYTPVDYSTQWNEEDMLQVTDPKRFGEQYGYGIMRAYELYESGDGPSGPEFVDPNSEYVNGLSPEEQNAYYEALHGPAVMEEDVGAASDTAAVGTVAPVESQGCYTVAWAEVHGDRPGDDPEIQEALGDVYENMESDPRLIDAYVTWAECVSPELDERGVTDDVDRPERMYEIVNRAKYEAQGLEVIEVESQAELDEYFNSGEPVYTAEMDENGRGRVYLGEPTELSGEEIDRLTTFEKDLWAADFECQERAQIAEVRRQLELDVVDRLVEQFPQLGG